MGKYLITCLFSWALTLGVYLESTVAHIIYFASAALGILGGVLAIVCVSKAKDGKEVLRAYHNSHPSSAWNISGLLLCGIPFYSIVVYTESWNTLMAALVCWVVYLGMWLSVRKEVVKRGLL